MAKTLEAHDKLIREIFEGSYQFEIPDYQRPYAWTTEQAGELFDDLISAMQDARVSGATSGRPSLRRKRPRSWNASLRRKTSMPRRHVNSLAMPSATAASRQPVLPSPRSCRRYRGFPRTMATQPRSRRCWTNLPLSSNGISDWREEKAYEVPSNHIQHSSLIFKESYL